MKNNKIIRLVKLIIWLTLTFSIGQTALAQPENYKGYVDLKEFPLGYWSEPEPATPAEREEKRKKNARYDKQYMVMLDPGPKGGGVLTTRDSPTQPIFPLNENDAVIIGNILSGKASLSNDKSGVYSEYIIEIKEVIRNTGSNKISRESMITIDRVGGTLIYPNGKRVVYQLSGKELPRVGSDYLLFLKDDNQSPNYEIVTGFELKDGNVNPLDGYGYRPEFRELKSHDINLFINEIRKLIQADSQSNKIKEKP